MHSLNSQIMSQQWTDFAVSLNKLPATSKSARNSPPATRSTHSVASVNSVESINSTERLNEARAAATLFMQQRGFEVVHENGQRISTNCAVTKHQLQQTSPWSEIFIGHLPRDMFEEELFPYLQQVNGTVHRIRVMMDFGGTNRGFCFVKFSSVEEAIRVVHVLDGKHLRPDSGQKGPDKPIGVRLSYDNKRLYIGNLPPRCTGKQFMSALVRAEVGGVVKVSMVSEPKPQSSMNFHKYHKEPLLPTPAFGRPSQPPPATGSYGYVYFDSHKSATQARRLLMPGEVKIMGRKLTIDWAKSEYPDHIKAALAAKPSKPGSAVRQPYQQQWQQQPSFNDTQFCTTWDSPNAKVHSFWNFAGQYPGGYVTPNLLAMNMPMSMPMIPERA